MKPEERAKLYDWLENGKVDVYLRRLMKERLAELEAQVGELEYRLERAVSWELDAHRRELEQENQRLRDALLPSNVQRVIREGIRRSGP